MLEKLPFIRSQHLHKTINFILEGGILSRSFSLSLSLAACLKYVLIASIFSITFQFHLYFTY